MAVAPGREQTLAGNVIDLQPHSVGVFEENRIVTGRPFIVLRRVDDGGSDRDQEGVGLLDLLALADPEADVVQADAALVEPLRRAAGRPSADTEPGPAADAVVGPAGVHHRLQPQERQKLAVESAGPREIAGGDEDVRDAVDFHGLNLDLPEMSYARPWRLGNQMTRQVGDIRSGPIRGLSQSAPCGFHVLFVSDGMESRENRMTDNGLSNKLPRRRWHGSPARVDREIWSFFSGAMGLDLGLQEAGLHSTLAVELERIFCRTIRMNCPRLDLIEGDISRLNAADLRQRRKFDDDVFLMVGGPPCQPFCSGGKRAALSDPRGNLIYEYFRLIAEVRPRYFVLENVANLTTAALRHRPIAERPGKHWSLKRYDGRANMREGGLLALEQDEMSGSALRQIIGDASSLGYHIAFGVLDAADFGAPQHRLRFVMLGSRDHPPARLPKPTHGAGLTPYVTVGESIRHLQGAPGAHSEYTPGVKEIFALVPPGGNWRSLPSDLQKAALGGSFEAGGGKTGFYRRLSWERPAPTITGRANRKGSALCHPEQDRPISVSEAAALQGFPPDWHIVGAMNQQYTQVGNAVPVRLGAAIGRAILSHDGDAQRFGIRHPDMEVMMAAAVGRLRAAARNHVARAA